MLSRMLKRRCGRLAKIDCRVMRRMERGALARLSSVGCSIAYVNIDSSFDKLLSN